MIPQHVIDYWRKQGRSEQWIRERNQAFINDYNINRKHPTPRKECKYCGKKVLAREMCSKHYNRWWRQQIK